MKKKLLINTLLISSLVLFSACGSNSKSDAGSGSAGATTGLSISYMSTKYEPEKGFIDHYRVHAADTNGKAVSGVSLRMSIINGVKIIRNKKLQLRTGGIESSTPITFFDSGVNFSQTNVQVGDNLIVIPSLGKTNNSYLGDWQIQSVGAQLTLSGGSFNLESTDGLTYVIGSEHRFLSGTRGRTTVAHIEAVKNNTDSDGFSYFDVVYDVMLGGHTVTLGVHTDGDRMSSGKIVGLRGGEYSSRTVEFSADGYTHYINLGLSIGFGGGGTEPLLEVNINPSSFIVSPKENCHLNRALSNFYTGSHSSVHLVIDTFSEADNNTTDTTTKKDIQCSVSWQGSNTEIYYEY